jgi:hypothetical protein
LSFVWLVSFLPFFYDFLPILLNSTSALSLRDLLASVVLIIFVGFCWIYLYIPDYNCSAPVLPSPWGNKLNLCQSGYYFIILVSLGALGYTWSQAIKQVSSPFA